MIALSKLIVFINFSDSLRFFCLLCSLFMNYSDKTEKDLVVFGVNPVIEAFQNPDHIEKVFLREKFTGERFTEIIKLCRQNKIPYFLVPKQKIDKISNFKLNQGVIAQISPVAFQNIENILPGLIEQGIEPFLLALDGVTDVRNMGAIARSAECAGVHAIIIPSKGSAKINNDAVKSSSGALLNLPVCRTSSIKHTLEFVQQSGLRLICATEKAEKNMWDADLTGPVCIVSGGEEEGISYQVMRISDDKIKIPMPGEISSLNVSVATGIVLFEKLRQEFIQVL